MVENSGGNVVELFPLGGKGSVLRVELYKVADRIDETVFDLRGELSPEVVKQLGHRLDDLDDMVTFLRALSGT